MASPHPADKNQHILLGLLGQSLDHSLSPVIHQAFLDELGLSGRYNKIEVTDSAGVAAKLSELADEGYSGLNVTIPYKLTVLPHMAALDETAELAGAVNTIKFGPQSIGFNTDISGLAEALSKLDLDSTHLADRPAKALILGSGGAARAAIIALSSLGFNQLEIFSRNKSNAQTMLDQLRETAQRSSLVQNCKGAVLAAFEESLSLGSPELPALSKLPTPSELPTAFKLPTLSQLPVLSESIEAHVLQALPDKGFGTDVSVVINATPIGQKDDDVPPALVQLLASVVKKSACPVFVDLVYGKGLTPLCRLAQELGFARVEDGKEMLINQARLAFKIWTGHLPEGQLARARLK